MVNEEALRHDLVAQPVKEALDFDAEVLALVSLGVELGSWLGG